MEKTPERPLSWFLPAAAVLAVAGGLLMAANYFTSVQDALDLAARGRYIFTSGTIYVANRGAAAEAEHLAAAADRDESVRAILAEASRVLAESGTSDPRLTSLRQRLLEYVEPRWKSVVSTSRAEILRFYLLPSGRLFLDVERPQPLGDPDPGVGMRLRAAPLDGGMWQGLRADPDFQGVLALAGLHGAAGQQGEEAVVGAVEVGIRLEGILGGLRREIQRAVSQGASMDYAVFARPSPGGKPSDRPVAKGWRLEAATDSFVETLLGKWRMRKLLEQGFGSRQVLVGDAYYAIGVTGLSADMSLTMPGDGEPVLLLASWSRISEAEELMAATREKNLVYGGGAYMLVLLVLYATVRLAGRKLRRIVNRRTAELAAAERRARSMIDNAMQGMFRSSLDGVYLSVNPAYARMLGYDGPEDLLGVRDVAAEAYCDPHQRERLLDRLAREREAIGCELRLRRRDGSEIWALADVRLIDDEQGQLVMEGILADITARKEAEVRLRNSEERFRELSMRDDLTGFYNTRHLYQALAESLDASRRGGRPLSVVFTDIDRFKQVVDTHGHLLGSRVIRELAAVTRTCLEAEAAPGAFGVSYGGDEFVFVLPGAAKAQALRIAAGLGARVASTNFLADEGLDLSISISLGVASYPEDADSLEELLAVADNALFKAKELCPGHAHPAPESHEEAS